MPAGTQFLSIYSERDGIVDWRACRDPFAVHAEVRSTHCGMGVNPAVYELLDGVLNMPLREPVALYPRARGGGVSPRGIE